MITMLYLSARIEKNPVKQNISENFSNAEKMASSLSYGARNDVYLLFPTFSLSPKTVTP